MLRHPPVKPSRSFFPKSVQLKPMFYKSNRTKGNTCKVGRFIGVWASQGRDFVQAEMRNDTLLIICLHKTSVETLQPAWRGGDYSRRDVHNISELITQQLSNRMTEINNVKKIIQGCHNNSYWLNTQETEHRNEI